MESRDQLLEYYNTGRYECDYDFYHNLQTILKYLNLYQYSQHLEQHIALLKQIKELTEINSKSLEEDYDDEQGLTQTHQIRKLLNNINTQQIPIIIKECQQLCWEPYALKVQKTLAGKTQYQKIIQRLQKSIHSEQLLIDSMIFTSLFQFRNGQLLELYNNIYAQALEHYLQLLTQQQPQLQFILQHDFSNLPSLPKTKTFVIVLHHILKICLRFCQIVKVLTGKNNLSLKFTVARKSIEKLVKKHGKQWKIQEQKEELFNILGQYKCYLKSAGHKLQKTSICSFCFGGLSGKEIGFHSFCRQLIESKNKFVIQ